MSGARRPSGLLKTHLRPFRVGVVSVDAVPALGGDVLKTSGGRPLEGIACDEVDLLVGSEVE